MRMSAEKSVEFFDISHCDTLPWRGAHVCADMDYVSVLHQP